MLIEPVRAITVSRFIVILAGRAWSTRHITRVLIARRTLVNPFATLHVICTASLWPVLFNLLVLFQATFPVHLYLPVFPVLFFYLLAGFSAMPRILPSTSAYSNAPHHSPDTFTPRFSLANPSTIGYGLSRFKDSWVCLSQTLGSLVGRIGL